MFGIENILAFKGGTYHKPMEGHTSFDITVVVRCKCKGYNWEQTLLCSNSSMCYHLTRICQVSIIKMCEGHSQTRVHVQNHETHGAKRWQSIRPMKLTTVIAIYGFFYDYSPILGNTLYVKIIL